MTNFLTRRHFLSLAGAALSYTLVPAPVRAAGKSDTLIICFSRTGNTAAMASFLSEFTGADILQIEPKVPYAASYSDMTYIARDEKRRGARREIATPIPDLSPYQTIFLGTPYWWGGISVPMYTFLLDHNLAGKTVAPFITSASSDPESALEEMKGLIKNAHVLEHFYVPGDEARSAKADMAAWVKRLKV